MRFSGGSQPVRRPKVSRCTWKKLRCAEMGHLAIDFSKKKKGGGFEKVYTRPSQAYRLSEQEFACFSYDENHEYRPDDSSIKYYYPPRLGADLSLGFDTFIKHDDSKAEHLDSLLKTIVSHEQETRARIDANVVTWRGMMTKVLFILSFASLHLGITQFLTYQSQNKQKKSKLSIFVTHNCLYQILAAPFERFDGYHSFPSTLDVIVKHPSDIQQF